MQPTPASIPFPVLHPPWPHCTLEALCCCSRHTQFSLLYLLAKLYWPMVGEISKPCDRWLWDGVLVVGKPSAGLGGEIWVINSYSSCKCLITSVSASFLNSIMFVNVIWNKLKLRWREIFVQIWLLYPLNSSRLLKTDKRSNGQVERHRRQSLESDTYIIMHATGLNSSNHSFNIC